MNTPPTPFTHPSDGGASVGLVHDYVTQRGGAERVVLLMLRAFPKTPLRTSLYLPDEAFPEFRSVRIQASLLNHVLLLRRHHRAALPFLRAVFSRMRVQGDVVICSSSGWAHGVKTEGRKIVYCYTPARWLYQPSRYLAGRNLIERAALNMLRARLVHWDQTAAKSADRYVTLSSAVRDRIRSTYGIDAEILPPPPAVKPAGPQHPVARLGSGFYLNVSRLLPYKNVAAVVEAFRLLPDKFLVIVGTGPEASRLAAIKPTNVRILAKAHDDELRWLYANCKAVVAASFEDYGLTPLEGAAFGKPAAALRWGGFLDTILDEQTGVFFDRPTPNQIAKAVRNLEAQDFSPADLQAHAGRFSDERFIDRLRAIVSEEATST